MKPKQVFNNISTISLLLIGKINKDYFKIQSPKTPPLPKKGIVSKQRYIYKNPICNMKKIPSNSFFNDNCIQKSERLEER